jgi:hypothetical protein
MLDDVGIDISSKKLHYKNEYNTKLILMQMKNKPATGSIRCGVK